MKKKKILDVFLFLTLIAILSLALIVLYSATHESDPLYSIKQVVFMLFGFALLLLVSFLDFREMTFLALPSYFFSLFLLIWVLINGRTISGSRRWIDLFFFNLQPSECMKLSYILTMSWYLETLKPHQKTLKNVFFALFLTAIPMTLIAMEPDLGTALVFVPICIGLLFVAEFSLQSFFFLFVLGLLILPMFWIFFLKVYQKKRILMYLNFQNDQFGMGWTINQSKIAIGSGQFFGKGWLKGSQTQLNFLPEHHTDFIFSVLAEEFGFLGVLFLFALFIIFFSRSLMIASKSQSLFGKYLVVGIVILIFFQMVINIGMTFGFFPVTGLPLPFFSYGGSSLVMLLIAVGFIFSVDKWND